MFGAVFSRKRIFMTGHTGFKGSWLTVWLNRLGADVYGYSLAPPSEPSMFRLVGLENDQPGQQGDIRDLETLTKAMREFRPDIVIHMAAQSLVRRSYREPVDTFATNVMGTVNVLEAARHVPSVRGIINVTSDKCYENLEMGRAFREQDPLGGSDPYSASKGCAELVARSWGTSFCQDGGPILISVRAGNVIGGGDFAEDRLLPDMARAFSDSRPVHIRSPKAIRPWQFVLEPLSGYLALAQKALEGDTDYAGGWNFGPATKDTQTVGNIVQQFARHWGDSAKVELDSAPQPHEAETLRLDCTKSKQELGWQPRTDIQVAMDWTAEWYKAWHAQTANLRELTERQIQRFEELP